MTVAFGDQGPRKKSWFERLTLLVVLIMAAIMVGTILLNAYMALK